MNFLGFVLNGVILILLGATIFFAVRLSLSLKAFRESRAGLSALIADLSRNIDQAQIAIAGLRETARDAGKDLQDRIAAARQLRDELDVMTESGGNLAKRLEGAATRAREEGVTATAAGTAALFRGTSGRPPARPASGGFAIRDRDADVEVEVEEPAPASAPSQSLSFPPGPDREESRGAEALHSKAERDLYAALRKGARGGGA